MIRNYLKIAWKVLRRNRFFSFVSLFGISMTIGIVLILASLFEQLVGKHYPENPSGHTLMVSNVNLNDGQGSNYTGGPGYYLISDYILNLKSPTRIAYSTQGYVANSFVGNKKLTLDVRQTSAEFWEVHAFTFVEGSAFRASHIEGRARVAAISQATSDDYFGAGVSAIGKAIKLDNVAYNVIGVFKNISKTKIHTFSDIFIPYLPEESEISNKGLIGGFYVFLEGKSQADLDKIREEYQSVVARIGNQLKKDPVDGKYINMSSHAVTHFEQLSYIFSSGNMSPEVGSLYLALGIPMLLFMLLPALNLVNLNSSRIMERFSEIGVRKAFGATSLNLTQQFIIENIMITLIGGAIGLAIALVGLEIIESSGLIKHADLGFRFNIFLFALLLCLFFGLLSGVLPAWRMSKVQVVNALNEIHT